MQKRNFYFLGLVFFCLTSVRAQYTDIINSNRPGKSISAFSVGETVIQAEMGLYGIKEKHEDLAYEAQGFGSDLSVRYGAFFEQLEFSLDAQYQYDWYKAPLINDTRGGFKQITLGAKYLIYDPFLKLNDKPNLYSWKANHKFNWKDFIPAVGLYAGFNLGIGDNPFYPDDKKFSPKLMVITQNHFGSRWVWVNNFFLDKLMSKYQGIGWISTMTRGFNMRWSGFLEAQAFKGDEYSDLLFRFGAAYLVRENIQLDLSITKNVKTTPEILMAGFGIAWRFDANHETVYMRAKSPKDEKKDKEKKGKKDKRNKGKKRKDEVELENTKP